MGSRQLDNAAAVILAGGKSSRMGRPKALLPFGSETLIELLVRRLSFLFEEIVVVGAPAQELPALGAKIVRDEIAYRGPVGGLYYGLRAATKPVSFVTSCDVPLLNLALVSYLVEQAGDYDVVVPYWEDRLEPLHAVYRSRLVPLLQEQLERNELRPVFLYDKVRTRKIGADEIRKFDPEGLSFLNMNTPADYEAALRRWQEMRQRNETERASGPRDGQRFETAPVSITVELFGVARLLAKVAKVELTLAHGATIADALARLAEEVPALAGKVVERETRTLARGYACNLNGREFVRDPSAEVRAGDSLFILSADAGG
ncbi:MAG TPA: NTP transferase domain-containing protein [Candidatus Acidoferrales bacterium]|nr:NTP transferase domain-containing protein [Candidatus Acidoferrales bacterium]